MKELWVLPVFMLAFGPESVLAAGGAPGALFNKSVRVTYNILAPTVEGLGRDRPSFQTREFYVSSQGRLFSRSIRNGGGSTKIENVEPGGSYHFENNKIVWIQAAIAGASKLEVSFDSGYRNCSASVILGRTGNTGFRWTGPDGRQYTLAGTPSVTNMSCSVIDGNIFAN